MSTRCQVQVCGGLNQEKVTLYHHCDGYPSNMLPLFKEAWDKFIAYYAERRKEWDKNWETRKEIPWELLRAGKVAGILCFADPGQFEPEEGHDLHDDIEWYYRITMVLGKEKLNGGHEVDDEHHGDWMIEVFDSGWDAKSVDDMKLVHKGLLSEIGNKEFGRKLEERANA